MKIFNHVQIKVQNLNTSRIFYDSIMSVLGYKIVLEIEGIVIGYGTSVHDMFEISQTTEQLLLSQSVHIAFNASSVEAVNTFFHVALQHGAKSNGEPDFRPEYEEGYYAAFVIDLNGHNIEAVYSEKRK